jgi:hypothetical protein
VWVREIDDDEGRRLVRFIRRGSGSVVTWRRAQMVLLSAQGMDATAIAKVAFTSEDPVRDVISNFDADGFGRSTRSTSAAARRSPPWASGGRCQAGEYDLPFSTSLAKLAGFRWPRGGRRH